MRADYDIDILCYRVQIKSIEDSFTHLPIDEISKYYKNNASTYQEMLLMYHSISNNVNCLISTWEQQIYMFCVKHIHNCNNWYKTIKTSFINYGINPTIFNPFDEYRHLDNVIKHGKNTNSYIELIKINSKFIKQSQDFADLSAYPVNLNMLILNINKNTIVDLSHIIDDFWDKLSINIKSLLNN